MALTDFFRINMPYGMRKNSKGEWFLFNREYVPLGWNKTNEKSIYDDTAFGDYPVFTKYKLLTDALLEKVAWDKQDGVKRDKEGRIELVFLYNDRTNPQSEPGYWDVYFEKIRLLSRCTVG